MKRRDVMYWAIIVAIAVIAIPLGWMAQNWIIDQRIEKALTERPEVKEAQVDQGEGSVRSVREPYEAAVHEDVSPASIEPEPSPSIAFANDSEIERLLAGEFYAEEAFKRAAQYFEKDPGAIDIHHWDQLAWAYPVGDGAYFIVDREMVADEVYFCQIRVEASGLKEAGGILRDSFREDFGLKVTKEGKVVGAVYYCEAHIAKRQNEKAGINVLLGNIVDGIHWQQDGDRIFVAQHGFVDGKIVSANAYPTSHIVGEFRLSQETLDRFSKVFVRWLKQTGVAK